MKLTGLFKRGAACLCTAAILMGGVSAFALSPALPDEPAPAELSVTNAVSEAQLRSALSKLTVTYNSEAEGWQIDSPYEDASMEKASCGLYPYLFITNDDPTVYLSLGMTYFGTAILLHELSVLSTASALTGAAMFVMTGFEVFVAFLQAYIFTILSTVYIKLSVEHH